MIEHATLKQKTHDFYQRQASVDSYALNAFDGTFAFSSHEAVPQLIRELVLSQRNEDKYLNISLSVINDIANSFWEGAGSCAKISDIIWDCRIARAFGATYTESKNAYTLNRSVEDWEAIANDS